MADNIRIRQVHTNFMCCEPALRRTANGELLCLSLCDGFGEPHPLNRVYAFHSKDNGETWSEKQLVGEEDGTAAYVTEVSVFGDEITAYMPTFINNGLWWDCKMAKSYDNGYTWEKVGYSPVFEKYCYLRSVIKNADGDIVIPYQYFPVSEEEYERILRVGGDKTFCQVTNITYCENGVLISKDGGKTFDRFMANQISFKDGWVWTEPTVAKLSDGTLTMLIRTNVGWLWRCDSKDGGRTWSETYQTDIPNPSNKPKLIEMDRGRIALISTPNNDEKRKNKPESRFPLELWISDDDMKTWGYKQIITDFPGMYCYAEGFYEDGHIHFAVEHNRHTLLYVDVKVD